MKDNKTKERFIELRGQGLPLARIAAEINVSKPTLINWGHEFREEIDNAQAIDSRRCTTSITSRYVRKWSFLATY
ncbi:MAG: hypothetical protein ACXVI7_09170 [Halobacteriota archaeon]